MWRSACKMWAVNVLRLSQSKNRIATSLQLGKVSDWCWRPAARSCSGHLIVCNSFNLWATTLDCKTNAQVAWWEATCHQNSGSRIRLVADRLSFTAGLLSSWFTKVALNMTTNCKWSQIWIPVFESIILILSRQVYHVEFYIFKKWIAKKGCIM